ncbi:hypothetical protein VNO77_27404 [Canavalia gladiata]|uniref:Uncharacterized protein n=1 Tax=Canavalia gladiata TaxID=3824 RepID=A0AAN9KWW3_CANGL
MKEWGAEEANGKFQSDTSTSCQRTDMDLSTLVSAPKLVKCDHCKLQWWHNSIQSCKVENLQAVWKARVVSSQNDAVGERMK